MIQHTERNDNRVTMMVGVTLVFGILLFVCGSACADTWSADFSSGEITGSIEMRGFKIDNNPAYRGSFRLLVPNESYLEGEFTVPNRPDDGVLRITHLSSSSADANLRGSSPITITINGHAVVRDFDPGSHGFVTDTLNVAKYLKEGKNRFRIAFGNGTTHYWIKSLAFEVK